MSQLENAILTLNRLGSKRLTDNAVVMPDGRANLAVTLVYLLAVLSMPLTMPVRILLLAIYPMTAAPLVGIPYSRIFLKSLYILPLVALFGIFNPIFDHEEVILFGKTVSRGWITFISISLRGILAFQALLILIETEGFDGMCTALRKLRLPALLTTQLQMVYRYLTVLLTEALTMQRAREARGFGRKTLTISQWGPFIGQLFIRTVNRSERINKAMMARGFNGVMPEPFTAMPKWSVTDTAWLLIWCAAIAALRFADIPALFRFNF